MYPIYRELREKLGPPQWHDREGVPRYCRFTPEVAAEIYCDWVALLEVRCQACGKLFKCAVASSAMDRARALGVEKWDHLAAILEHFIGWGDAPWHTYDGDECRFGGQCSGTTMTTDYRVVGLWRKSSRRDFEPVEIPSEYLGFEECAT